jgi:hypothetical protein
VPKYSKAKPFDIIQTIMDMQKDVTALQILSPGSDTWHPIGGTDAPWSQTNWAPTGGGFSTPAYKRLPNNLLALKGDVTFSATASVGLNNPNTILTLPANYTPIETQSVPLTYYAVAGTLTISTGRVPLLQVNSVGVVSCFNFALTAATSAAVRLQLNCIVPLDS